VEGESDERKKSREEVEIINEIKQIDELLSRFERILEELSENGLPEEEVEMILQELRDISSGKENLVTRIRRQIRNLYERFYERYRESAITTINADGFCQACFVRATPRQVADIKTGRKLVFCESCGRILIWRGEDNEKD